MAKFFNTAGYCRPGKHYMVDPLTRFHGVEKLIQRELYFTIHAPRQTGKTTYLHAFARKMNRDSQYIALVASFERAGVGSLGLDEANKILIDSVYRASQKQISEELRPENPKKKEYIDLSEYLETWAQSQEKAIVLLIDEIDALLDDVLISVLRQLRDGYQSRPEHFPSSVALVGLRDVREYKTQTRKGQRPMGTASPFNVKAESLFLENFTKEQVASLLEQHTHETRQVFPSEVKTEIFRLTRGQPWLTNALANQIVSGILDDDYSKEITLDLVEQAKRAIILRRDTHLDSLLDKLREDRVKQIVQLIINGSELSFDVLEDQVAYVRDLGIVSQTSPLEFANPIYAEIIPRVMGSPIQESIPKEVKTPFFINSDGSLEMEKVLKEFQAFYRQSSESWLERFEYKESAHHLLLMAFLQRIVNSGGSITREMAVGNGRIDLLVKFGPQKIAMELKIKWKPGTIERGKNQLVKYLEKLGLQSGFLVIFDPAPKDWSEKLYWQEVTYKGKQLIMVGL